MKLSELLPYDNIVVQCHDNPDADALASGFALWFYFRLNGRKVRFVYGGANKVQKSDLVLMIERCGIPVEHVTSLQDDVPLLVTVDCQWGGGNVTKFSAKKIAVIDHHPVSENLPADVMREIRSYGSCATLLWDMLRSENIDVNHCNAEAPAVSADNCQYALSTALYYGLFIDTTRLQEIRHPKDKDMRDGLKVNESDLFLMQNTSMTIRELELAGKALEDFEFDPDRRFAIVSANPCDQNLLGIISDMVIEVDVVDVCTVFSPQENGVRFSVRSSVPDTHAKELAIFLTAGLGEGGGHARKAGGSLKLEHLLKDLDSGEAVKYSDMRVRARAHDILVSRLTDYLEIPVWDTEAKPGASGTAGKRLKPPSLADGALYRKVPVTLGYVETDAVFGEGKDLLVRMLEGEFAVRSGKDMCIMIGVNRETYPIEREKLEQNYELTQDAYELTPEVYGLSRGDYLPTVQNRMSGETTDLLAHAKKCVSRGTTMVRAMQLTHPAKLFTKWSRDNYMKGEAGDWLVAGVTDETDMYIVKERIFEKIYRAEGEPGCS